MDLLDANERRSQALAQAVEEAGWLDRVGVVHQRAEGAGRSEDLRGAYDVVVSRSFGPPAVTAECAAPFLAVGGSLVVSEPPLGIQDGVESPGPVTPTGHPERWPDTALAAVGMVPVHFHLGTSGFQVLRQFSLCPTRYPRREGVPAKRPLYR